MKKTFFQPVSPQVNFPELEKKILHDWYDSGLVEKYLHRNDSAAKRFSFLDGPITANNPMGVHHAWGRTFKDLWQRFYALRGYKERFQNGFDCQGLWVEVEVEKELGLKNKKDIENLVPNDKKASIAKFVELCKERVRKYSTIQTEQSKRLGYIVDWNKSYFTMSDENNYMIWHFLKTCFTKGWIYKGRDSVPWCPRCETAISQHEMLTEDYKEVTHKAVYLEFPIVGRDNEFLLVWTTTPWTIPANIAIAVDAALDYCLVEGDTGNLFWLVKERVDALFTGVKKIIRTVKGSELVGLKYTGPFDDLPAVRKAAADNPKLFHSVVATDPLILPVLTTEGTGLVHTAVSAGSEDFKLGKKYGLPMIPVIDDTATYLQNLGFLTGQNAKKHPEIILDYLAKLNDSGALCVFLVENYTHRYPACWRCKTELVWKVADEWYIAMDKPESVISGKKPPAKGSTLRQQMMETARQITWKPGFGLDRELDWLANMHDWLISKPNRYWGLALPIYECTACGWFTVVGSKEELKEKAVSGWKDFEGHSPHKPFIDEVKIRCQSCGAVAGRLNDVGNVWLDAGIVGFSTLIDPETKKLSYTSDKKYWRQWYPADFITESFPGQFKNWFYSMIAMSTVLEKRTCFKTVLGYGSMLGEDGRPMHKSWGNAIEFNEGADKIGVDVMRWMFVRHNPEQNLLFGYRLADETRRKFHLLLWNIYNFYVTYANVDGWHNGKKPAKTHVLDKWAIGLLDEAVGKVTVSLSHYDAASASAVLEAFVTDLSQWYIRRSRDRVGPTVPDSEDRWQFYATLHEILVTLMKLLAPFTPFLSEEIYKNLTGNESVLMSSWPTSVSKNKDRDIQSKMNTVRKICELGHAQRKLNGIKVRQPLASCTVSNVPVRLEDEYLGLIRDELNVKHVKLSVGKDELAVTLDTEVTVDLKMEGDVRDLIRQIQMLRKENGCKLTERIAVTLPKTLAGLPSDLQKAIARETLADTLSWGDSLKISIG